MNNIIIGGLCSERASDESSRGMKEGRVVEDGCMAAWMDGR